MPRQNVSLSLASRAHSGVLHAARTAYRHPRVASDDARTVGTDSADMVSCFVQKDELSRISSLTLSGISLAEREEKCDRDPHEGQTDDKFSVPAFCSMQVRVLRPRLTTQVWPMLHVPRCLGVQRQLSGEQRRLGQCSWCMNTASQGGNLESEAAIPAAPNGSWRFFGH